MDAIAAAERIAQDVLLPAAEAVDRADRVPVEHFDLLGREGLYGLAGPQAAGRDALGAVVEALASGCLATTFVWLQHHGALAGAAGSARPEVRERWVRPLATGERRAGIALAGLRPDPAPLRVRADGGPGFVLSGEVAWVTGWDMIDTVYLAARDADDLVHFFLLDAVAGDTLSARPLELIAAQASRTVTLRFDGHR
ncbi:MAG TPA: acyl-CoA dehydrogenase family protein, partial [Micromonosporaceae bacterium]|nr:acyl-CoA dehydrogenase family protein [Micromonosporaceae bacterium]